MSKNQKVGGDEKWLHLFLAIGVFWGCSFLFIEQALKFLNPVGVSFLRCLCGATTIWIIVLVKKIKIPRDRKLWMHVFALALMTNVIPGTLIALAQTNVTSVLAGIINSTTPLTTLLAIMLFFRHEKIKSHQVLGLFIGFIGVATVFGIWRGLGENAPWAIGVLVVAVIFYGITYPYTTKFVFPLKARPEVLAVLQVTFGGIFLLPFFIMGGIKKFEFMPISIISVIALGAITSGLAPIWHFRLLSIVGSSITSSVAYMTPIVAVTAGVVLLGEPLSWNEPVGGLLVLAGTAISQGRHLPNSLEIVE
ncbi:transporter [Actinomycetes bacterium]|nr:transporter [Actinomycetes bacterium]